MLNLIMYSSRKIKFVIVLPFLILIYFSTFENYNSRYFFPDSLSPLNCSSLFAGDERAILKAKYWHAAAFDPTPHELTCDFFKQNFRFSLHPESTEEANYPLAAVIVVHRNFWQFLRMFEAIYASQNSYCISIDDKSDSNFKLQVENLIACFKNVKISKPLIKIYWGHFSVLEAAVNCLRILNKNSREWKYVQILSWSDVPLKTNLDLVRIFKILNGSNDAELVKSHEFRWQHHHHYVPDNMPVSTSFAKIDNYKIFSVMGGVFVYDEQTTRKPPGNLTIYKGSFGASLTRETVRFMFQNRLSRKLYKFLVPTIVPDESYWSTLVHNPQIGTPGSFPGICADHFETQGYHKPRISSYSTWYRKDCGGQMIHGSCSFGVKDLQKLKETPELVAKKVYREIEPATFHCLIELHWQRRLMGRDQSDELNLTYYEKLPSVKHKNDKTYRVC